MDYLRQIALRRNVSGNISATPYFIASDGSLVTAFDLGHVAVVGCAFRKGGRP